MFYDISDGIVNIQSPAILRIKADARHCTYAKGQSFRRLIVWDNNNRVVVKVDVSGAGEASLVMENIVPPVTDASEMAERFKTGSTLHAWVRRVNKRGKIQLTLKEPRI